MDRLWNLTDQFIGGFQNLTGNQQDTGHVIDQHTSRNNDSGVGTELNVSGSYFSPLSNISGSYFSPSNFNPAADIMAYRLQHIHFGRSDDVRNDAWSTRDENKENICPFSGQNHTNRQRENHTEQGAFSLPLLVEQGPSRSSSDSALSRSQFSSPVFSPFTSSHPIYATPRLSSTRRRARPLAGEAEFVSMEDLPEMNPSGSNGTPPRTPSPHSFTELSDSSGSQDSNEILNNEQRRNEHAFVVDAGTAIGTSFVTPPSKPPLLPTAPIKKKVDKKSPRTIGSPSFFPENSIQLGKQSCTLDLALPRKRNFTPSPTNTNVSSMVLRSALKPRRSARIKRTPNRYKCNFDLLLTCVRRKGHNVRKHYAAKA